MIFDCVFAHEDVRCANRTGIKDGLQYANKKHHNQVYDYIYTLGFNNELET